MSVETYLWIAFGVTIVTVMALDLGVFHRKAHVIRLKEALTWTAAWVSLALLFNVAVWIFRGSETALEFLAGYIIEYSLSVDNIFVFLLIFTYFQVPAAFQHRVLFWGIMGALVMRAIMIALGVGLIENFHWVIYIFGAFLVFTGIRMAKEKDKEVRPERNPVLRLVRRFFSVTDTYQGGKFFVRNSGKLLATPMFIVLVVVETTDLVFAIDSIPAILAITTDPFVVYTSNAFAIMGLRSLYFGVAGIMRLFHYLHYGLSAILVFVGIKMLISDFYHLPIVASLSVVGGILAASVIASLLKPQKKTQVVETGVERPDTRSPHQAGTDSSS